MDHRNRKYLGTNKSSASDSPPVIKFYNNGTIATHMLVQNFTDNNNRLIDQTFVAGQGTDWITVPDKSIIYASVNGNMIGAQEFWAYAGKKYQIVQDCWWPKSPCLSVNESDQ